MLKKILLTIALVVACISVPVAAEAKGTTVAQMEAMGWAYTPAEKNPHNLGPVSQKAILSWDVNSLCLYQWVNFGAAKWCSTFANFWNNPNNCITITPATWPNGTPVSDNSGSLIANGNGDYDGVHYSGDVYDSGNCNAQAGVAGFPAHFYYQVSNLQNLLLAPSTTAYHRISSVAFRYCC